MSSESNPNYSSIFGDIYRTDWATYANHSDIPTVTSSPTMQKCIKCIFLRNKKQQVSIAGSII